MTSYTHKKCGRTYSIFDYPEGGMEEEMREHIKHCRGAEHNDRLNQQGTGYGTD